MKECTGEVYCVICKEVNKDCHHRMGSVACVRNRMQIDVSQKTATSITVIAKSDSIVNKISEVMDVIINTDNDK